MHLGVDIVKNWLQSWMKLLSHLKMILKSWSQNSWAFILHSFLVIIDVGLCNLVCFISPLICLCAFALSRMQQQMMSQVTSSMFRASLQCTLDRQLVQLCSTMGIEQRMISLSSFKRIGIPMPNQSRLNQSRRKMSYEEGKLVIHVATIVSLYAN